MLYYINFNKNIICILWVLDRLWPIIWGGYIINITSRDRNVINKPLLCILSKIGAS